MTTSFWAGNNILFSHLELKYLLGLIFLIHLNFSLHFFIFINFVFLLFNLSFMVIFLFLKFFLLSLHFDYAIFSNFGLLFSKVLFHFLFFDILFLLLFIFLPQIIFEFHEFHFYLVFTVFWYLFNDAKSIFSLFVISSWVLRRSITSLSEMLWICSPWLMWHIWQKLWVCINTLVLSSFVPHPGNVLSSFKLFSIQFQISYLVWHNTFRVNVFVEWLVI